jgi:hypothetical protein
MAVSADPFSGLGAGTVVNIGSVGQEGNPFF